MGSERGFLRGFLRGEDGAALIEAALILPVLLMLVFALADLSLYFWQASLARKAADLGVRAATVSDAVAEGPGLTYSESGSYWFGLPPGLSCRPVPGGGSPCPAFSVRCSGRAACLCEDGRCGFRYSAAKLAPILAAMRAVLPGLSAENVEVGYATNGLGYVGRPPPVPVDVTVRIVGYRYDALFLGLLFRDAVPLAAAATLPGEDLAR